MRGKSRKIKDGWWAGAIEGDLGGQKAIMLRYDDDRRTSMKASTLRHCPDVIHPAHSALSAMDEGREVVAEHLVRVLRSARVAFD